MRRASMRSIAAEGALLAGGGRAILLQLADPVIASGVARHSDFRGRPHLRLQATLTYVYTVVFGTPDQVGRVRRQVNRAHGPVPGAFDAELQLWVAATLYETAAGLDERLFGPLDPASVEQVYLDNAVLGTSLQMPPELWPHSHAAFREYWAGRLAGLEVTADARRVAAELLHPAAAPWWLRAGMPLARLVTAGLLPAELRAAYGLPWSRLRQRRFDRVLRLLAAVYRTLPRRIRHWPMRHYLKRVPARPPLR